MLVGIGADDQLRLFLLRDRQRFGDKRIGRRDEALHRVWRSREQDGDAIAEQHRDTAARDGHRHRTHGERCGSFEPPRIEPLAQQQGARTDQVGGTLGRSHA